MKGEAKAIYDAVVEDLIHLNAHWDVFKKLFTVSEGRYAVYGDTAPGFFRILQNVLVDNAVISLSRLTDPARFQSLPRLVKLLESQVTHTFHAEVEADLSSLRSACEDIRKHRDERVAHKVRKPGPPYLEAAPEQLPALTRQKIERAMTSSAALLNKILAYFESTEQYYVPIVRGDAESLYFYLEKGHQAVAAERQTRIATFTSPKSP